MRFFDGRGDAGVFEEVADVQDVVAGAVGVEFDGDCGGGDGGCDTV